LMGWTRKKKLKLSDKTKKHKRNISMISLIPNKTISQPKSKTLLKVKVSSMSTDSSFKLLWSRFRSSMTVVKGWIKNRN
jgi:hypothetical protein